MSKTVLLEQVHPATGTKMFLTFLKEGHIKHLIKLARDHHLTDLMAWNTSFEDKV